MFEGYPSWVSGAVAVVVTLVISYLIAEVIARGAWRLLRPLLGERAAGFQGAPLLRPIRLIRVVVFLLVAASIVLPAFELVGFRTFAHLKPEALIAWLVESGVRIGLIILLAYVIVRVTGLVLSRFEQDFATLGGADHLEQLKRVRTLGNLVRSAAFVIVSTVATLMILRELQLDITPVLTTAGILGLAVGFGAQTLVKDVISGFFMILENQVRVGDVASINGTGGFVEAITLRTIVLRDETGTVHVFPNGSINTLANLTKDFSYYLINLGVDYSEDTDRVIDLLVQIADELSREAKYGASMLQPLEVIGVDDFTESKVVIKVRIKTLPLKQWEVGREFRRRIKKRFDSDGVQFPYSKVTVHVSPGDGLAQLAQALRTPAVTSLTAPAPAPAASTLEAGPRRTSDTPTTEEAD
jgi:small conductance mechanosensitive channel